MAEYVERNKAFAMRFSDGLQEDGLLYVPYRDVVNHLKSLPAADVRENVRGEWKKCRGRIYESNNWFCTNCEEVFMVIEGTPKNNSMCYCPHCGADMRGGTE